MKYVALLRGVNVGGKRIIPMTGLKTLFYKLGCSHVITYIQSGNVVFEPKNEENDVTLAYNIEQSIPEHYGESIFENHENKYRYRTALFNFSKRGSGNRKKGYHQNI